MYFIRKMQIEDLNKVQLVAKGFQVVSEFDDDFEGHTLKTVRMVLKL